MNNGFKKEERLCSKKIIGLLFTKGQVFFVHPFKVHVLVTELNAETKAQVLFNVSKRFFNKANERNRIKRLLRESYRVQKHAMYQQLESVNKQIAIAIVCTKKEEITYQLTYEKVNQILVRIIKDLTMLK